MKHILICKIIFVTIFIFLMNSCQPHMPMSFIEGKEIALKGKMLITSVAPNIKSDANWCGCERKRVIEVGLFWGKWISNQLFDKLKKIENNNISYFNSDPISITNYPFEPVQFVVNEHPFESDLLYIPSEGRDKDYKCQLSYVYSDISYGFGGSSNIEISDEKRITENNLKDFDYTLIIFPLDNSMRGNFLNLYFISCLYNSKGELLAYGYRNYVKPGWTLIDGSIPESSIIDELTKEMSEEMANFINNK